MKKARIFPLIMLMSAAVAVSSCSKQKEADAAPAAISKDVLGQIKALGFGTQNVRSVAEGFVVEGDILLTPQMLSSTPDRTLLRVGKDEQFRTANLVGGLPRILTVKVSSQFPASYVAAADEAIRRYNDADLQLNFRRIESGTADLPIQYAADLGPGVLGQSGGFPSGGNPAPGFKLVPSVIGNRSTDAIATIMAHEIGHCIGFRHTDYFNRAFSCGGFAVNEGQGDVGAIFIPGTAFLDSESWMLACVGNNQDRPFTDNDIAALDYLY